MIQEVIYAYIAGLIDGEGCIYVQLEYKNNKLLRTRIRLQITNTNKLLLERVKEMTGVGSITKGIKTKDKWKIRYDWFCYETKAVDILQKCLPYMIAKKEQAELAIKFINGEVSAEHTKEQMNKLNKKGELYAL